jgi:hypothetical protein
LAGGGDDRIARLVTEKGARPPGFLGESVELGAATSITTWTIQAVAASTTTEGIGLTSLVSTVALITLFGTGFAATAGRPLSRGYLIIAGIALALVVAVLALAHLVGTTPASPSGPGAGWPGWRGTSGQASIQRK